MSVPTGISALLGKYSSRLDQELQDIFSSVPSHEMYKHMAYFMGFANEKFEPEQSYGGKRFRSSLSLLLGEYYGVFEQVVPAAISIELFHNFTLIHDDIVDGDTLRRGRPTVWKLVGVDHAINSGDAQMLMALEVVMTNSVLSAEQKVELQTFLLIQYRKVAEGQFLDFKLTESKIGDEGVSEIAYEEMVGHKTADLIAAATVAPGLMASLSKKEKESLFNYGYALGMAYQICDDIVSIWGKSKQTGKRACGDILERKKTLPILWWYEQASADEKSTFEALYNEDRPMSEESAVSVVKLLDAAGTYEEMMKRMKAEASIAHESISALSLAEEQKKVLSKIVDVLLIDIKAV